MMVVIVTGRLYRNLAWRKQAFLGEISYFCRNIEKTKKNSGYGTEHDQPAICGIEIQ